MDVYLSLGSNLGDRQQTIISAIEQLADHAAIANVIVSNLYITKPFGLANQRDYINCAVRLETSLSPKELLADIQHIELSLGRKREIKWGPRTIDIDILFYGDYIIQELDLIIPHPEMHKRAFVLKPLAELCPDLIHAVLKRTVRSL